MTTDTIVCPTCETTTTKRTKVGSDVNISALKDEKCSEGDIFKLGYIYQSHIEELKNELKEYEKKFRLIISEISNSDVTSPDFIVAPASSPVREADPTWFANNFPEIHKKYAHVQPKYAVEIMSTMCGSPEAFQDYLRNTDPAKFDIYSSMSVTEMDGEFDAETMQKFEALGGISRKLPDKMKIIPVDDFRRKISSFGKAQVSE